MPVLANLDFTLDSGFTGLVGRNGSGKTTLLRLLAGELEPDRGAVEQRPKGLSVALCPQGVLQCDAAIQRLAAASDARARRLSGLFQLDPPALQRFATLSPGERKRWQLAAAIHGQADVLLLDEPTNHLDAEGRAALLAALADFRGIGVVVSHDRALLNALCPATLCIAGGTARLLRAPYDAARAAWEAEEAEQRRRFAELRSERRAAAARATVARERSRGAERGPKSKGRKDRDARSMGAKNVAAWAAAAHGRRAEVERARVERLDRELAEFRFEPRLGADFFVGYQRAPAEVVLALDGAEIAAGGRVLVRDVRLDVGRADRVHLAGPNGAGKTTLLRALVASCRLPPERVLDLAQDQDPAADQALLAEVRRLEPAARGRTLAVLGSLGVDPAGLLRSDQPSFGEAKKLRFALALGRGVALLVLDEPTNHLDLPAVEALEDALARFPGALVLVTHDERLAAACATRRVELANGTLCEVPLAGPRGGAG